MPNVDRDMVAVQLSASVRADPAAGELRAALARLNVPQPQPAIAPDRTWLVAREGDPEIASARANGYRIAIAAGGAAGYAGVQAELAAAATEAVLSLRALIRNLW